MPKPLNVLNWYVYVYDPGAIWYRSPSGFGDAAHEPPCCAGCGRAVELAQTIADYGVYVMYYHLVDCDDLRDWRVLAILSTIDAPSAPSEIKYDAGARLRGRQIARWISLTLSPFDVFN